MEELDLDINEHGVEGRWGDCGVFRPLCCLQCHHYDWEPTQDGFGQTFYHCALNTRFPTRTGICKRQKKIKR
jgi:hypothetical protein